MPLVEFDDRLFVAGEAGPPAFKPEPDAHGGITVKAPVGVRHALFLGLRVIQGEHIQIERHVASGKRRELRLSFFEKLDRAEINDGAHHVGKLVEALVQGLRRWNFRQSQGAAEELVILKGRPDRGKVTLALTEQAQIRTQHIGGRNPPFRSGLVNPGSQRGVAIQRHTD